MDILRQMNRPMQMETNSFPNDFSGRNSKGMESGLERNSGNGKMNGMWLELLAERNRQRDIAEGEDRGADGGRERRGIFDDEDDYDMGREYILEKERQIQKALEIEKAWEIEMEKEKALAKELEKQKEKNAPENISKEMQALNKVQKDIFFLCLHKNGCEYVINKLKGNVKEEKLLIFQSLFLDVCGLCTDCFGNYVAQSIYDLEETIYQEIFTIAILKHANYLTLHTYGCRLLQKALDALSTEYKCKVFLAIKENLITYICHQNGNHVIQKCVEVLPSEYIDEIIYIIYDYLPFLSSHTYGCRIIQRIYEIGNTQQINILNERVIRNSQLIKNRYGNYVIQKCFEFADDNVRSILTELILSNIYKLSVHKYACNIIEKILVKKKCKFKKRIITKIIADILKGDNTIIRICKDRYGNFIVQKLLASCKKKERNIIINLVIDHLEELKHEAYGKFILRAIKNLEN